MGKVSFDISMSLDGFITGANRRSDEPLGDGGEQLHEWAFDSDDEYNRKLLEESIASLGAVIAGRSTYEDAIPGWKADGPTGSARVPVFVVSHTMPDDIPEGGVYTFVDGIENALVRAQAAAGDKDISVMGGAKIAQQFIKAGLLDEISIHLVPVLFGSGTRLIEGLGGEHIQLETTEVMETKEAIHLRFRVIR
ncbi:MAG TPA: dihydrofolate reductase family protein [Aggregatilineaceae bacterium]|nr:dihydrofolate reductase family protein [Aggregatilineaceae bacterium]